MDISFVKLELRIFDKQPDGDDETDNGTEHQAEHGLFQSVAQGDRASHCGQLNAECNDSIERQSLRLFLQQKDVFSQKTGPDKEDIERERTVKRQHLGVVGHHGIGRDQQPERDENQHGNTRKHEECVEEFPRPFSGFIVCEKRLRKARKPEETEHAAEEEQRFVNANVVGAEPQFCEQDSREEEGRETQHLEKLKGADGSQIKW